VRARLRGEPGPDPFFYGAVGADDQIRREVFYLAYHLHWGRDEVMDLPTPERRAYLELLAEQIEREQRAADEARRGR
jgi:hypothetical protein